MYIKLVGKYRIWREFYILAFRVFCKTVLTLFYLSPFILALKTPVKRLIFQAHAGSNNDERKFPCEHCSYRATQPSHLKRHKESKHEGIRYPCDQCEYNATRIDKLKLHKQSIHEGIRYSCDLCAYSSPRSDKLKQHKRTKH